VCPDTARHAGRFRKSGLGSALLIAATLCVFLLPTRAQAWWNDDWSGRKKITIDTTAAGSAIENPIGTFPVLVRLHAGNFQFEGAKEDGTDIRFVAADDKTPLKFQIEKFDSLLGEAFFWVNVPDLKPGAKTEIWLYYGNSKSPGADPKGTFDADHVLVYHFAERGSPPADASTWTNHAQAAGQPAASSIVGPGLHLDGKTPLALPASPSLGFAENGALTWSAWINMEAAQPRAAIYGRREGANSFIIGLDNGVPFVEVTGAAGTARSEPGTAIAPGTWHHFAVVAENGQVTIYLDGASYGTFAAGIPAFNGAALLGGVPAEAAAAPADGAAPAGDGSAGFAGDIDELEISKVARPAGFVKAAAIGQGPDPAKFISFGTDEAGSSSWFGGGGYFGVILQSVTVDGWVVIVILVIMAAISWVVMVRKATFLNRQTKANAEFMERFRALTDDLLVLDFGEPGGTADAGGDADAKGIMGAVRAALNPEALKAMAGAPVRFCAGLMMKVTGRGEAAPAEPVDAEAMIAQDSSLYRIYRMGVAEIKKRLSRSRSSIISDQQLITIRAVIDAGFVKEAKQLNNLMVVLTIAISGGPFLGLLGTVVGVMITFAAIAATGDVNINAIAPGIAAALVATVAGLGVAIPALFGYNYLISSIKNLTSEIQVFVDEFIARTGETYQPHPEHPVRMAAE